MKEKYFKSGFQKRIGIITIVTALAVMFAMIGMAAAQESIPTANISGMKFSDLNNNGIKDKGEPGLANWTITLTSPGQEFPTTTLTDSSGNYTFTGLAPGNYTVGEVLQSGWMQTFPAAPGTYTIELNGVDVTGKDFGNFNSQGPTVVGTPVTPVALNIDLRTLPVQKPWQPGQPIIEAEGQTEPNSEIAGPEQIGTVTSKGGTEDNNGATQQQQLTLHADTQSSASALTDPISAPIINIDGIPNTGIIPPDTVGDVGPDHYIQAVNARFAIFDKSGNVLVGSTGGVLGGVNINQLWINASLNNPSLQNDACTINNNGDPIIKYDRLADRWIISQFVAYTNFCVAVSQTHDPITGGWFLYDFPSNGIPNDYPKYGVWPDAYYVGTNNNSGGGDAWAFDRTNMLTGGVAQPPIRFSAGGAFMLPSDLYGPSPPAGAPNVFARFVDGAEKGGVDRLELKEFHVDFANPAASTFNALPDLPTLAFDSKFCNSYGFRPACISQPGTTQKLDVLRGEPMYRLQYRNFGTYETLVVNHDVNVGNNVSGIRWYELHKSGGAWSIFQQGTHSPDATSRWMGSIAMDKDGNLALGYSVSSDTVFPGIRYVGRLANDPPGTMQGENTLVTGGGSQTSFRRWGDYSSMSVDPVDDCTFWDTSEYYPTTSAGDWRTRIGSFSFCSAISGTKFNDLNGNGAKDPGEPGLGGWQIDLNFTNGTVYKTTTTVADGSYNFTGVSTGNYILGEVLKPGWKQTAPPTGTYSVNITGGTVITGKDFGNKKFSVFGMKFNDRNGNRKRDAGEEGLAGWHIKLVGYDTLTGTGVNREEITDANGNYGFMDVTPGIYEVIEVAQGPNWVSTTYPTVPINLKANESINVNFGNKKIP